MASDRLAGIERGLLRRWSLNVVVPAIAAAGVYWYVAGPTGTEIGLFLGVFVVTLVAIEYFLDIKLEL